MEATHTFCMLYFSGTGNTNYIVNKLADELQNHGHHCRKLAADELLMQAHQSPTVNADPSLLETQLKDFLEGASTLLILYPTYASTIPIPLQRVLLHLPSQNGLKLGVISTIAGYGGDCCNLPFSLLKSRGYTPILSAYIKMPNNFCVPYFPHSIKNGDALNAFYAASEKKIQTIASDLLEGRVRFSGTCWIDKLLGRLQRLGSKYLSPWLKKNFFATKDCIQCRLCVESCPMSNIHFEQNHPTFDSKCCLCMRCYHFCPVSAIQITQKTENKIKFARYQGFNHWKPKRIAKLILKS